MQFKFFLLLKRWTFLELFAIDCNSWHISMYSKLKTITKVGIFLEGVYLVLAIGRQKSRGTYFYCPFGVCIKLIANMWPISRFFSRQLLRQTIKTESIFSLQKYLEIYYNEFLKQSKLFQISYSHQKHSFFFESLNFIYVRECGHLFSQ